MISCDRVRVLHFHISQLVKHAVPTCTHVQCVDPLKTLCPVHCTLLDLRSKTLGGRLLTHEAFTVEGWVIQTSYPIISRTLTPCYFQLTTNRKNIKTDLTCKLYALKWTVKYVCPSKANVAQGKSHSFWAYLARADFQFHFQYVIPQTQYRKYWTQPQNPNCSVSQLRAKYSEGTFIRREISSIATERPSSLNRLLIPFQLAVLILFLSKAGFLSYFFATYDRPLPISHFRSLISKRNLIFNRIVSSGGCGVISLTLKYLDDDDVSFVVKMLVCPSYFVLSLRDILETNKKPLRYGSGVKPHVSDY